MGLIFARTNVRDFRKFEKKLNSRKIFDNRQFTKINPRENFRNGKFGKIDPRETFLKKFFLLYFFPLFIFQTANTIIIQCVL